MTDLWQRLAEKKVLDDSLRQDIADTLGPRGRKALEALDTGKVKKYLDFFVVEGRTAEYVVDEDFCTCGDFMYRRKICWHLLAVRIALETGTYQKIDSWYQDTWKNKEIQ
jgi:predicted nucleic acid-binding Zn finger protein